MDIIEVICGLALHRPLFHSEADFQHALAWEIHKKLPSADVRLELPCTHNGKQIHVDLWITHEGLSLALELKYKTRTLMLERSNERFSLSNHSAQDTGRYDFIKDIQRLEQITANQEQVSGYAIFLTNDSSYWSPPKEKKSVDADFRIQEGRTLHGQVQWQPHASVGTMRSREAHLTLEGTYCMAWKDYSIVAPSSGGQFRFNAVKVCGIDPTSKT